MTSITEETLVSSPPQPHCTSELPLFTEKKKENQTISVSFRTLTYCTSIPLIVIPIILCKQGCERGDYECTIKDFPYVSKTLGVFPNDKTYIFMMNFFTAV